MQRYLVFLSIYFYFKFLLCTNLRPLNLVNYYISIYVRFVTSFQKHIVNLLKGNNKKHNHLSEWLANFFLNELDNKYFRLATIQLHCCKVKAVIKKKEKKTKSKQRNKTHKNRQNGHDCALLKFYLEKHVVVPELQFAYSLSK